MAVIKVENLVKHYGDRVAVDDVSFTVEEGEIFGLLGSNGAGKTTTVETIAGLRKPDRGRARVQGMDPIADGARVKQLLGVQLQEARFPDKLRVGEALDLYGSFYRDPAPPDELLADLGLVHQRDTAFTRLSGGQQQRLSIAVALMGRPRIAILDELTTGLDPRARRDTWSLVEGLRDRGVTILLVTHFMDEAEHLADRVAVMDNGRLVALDTPARLIDDMATPQVMRFHPSSRVDDTDLRQLPEVSDVSRDGEQVTITGSGNVVYAVMSFLAQRGIVAQRLRVDTGTLDDAYLALTGRPLETADATEE